MIFETIEKLCGLPGVSGNEDAVRAEIIRMIEGKCSYRIDALGNILAVKTGKKRPGKRLMMSAHMDEVGLIITYIEDNGLLRFSTVGGIDKRVLPGKSVRIGAQGVFGVIGLKALHQRSADERETAPKIETLLIDIGADSAQEAEKMISLGDRAVFNARYYTFGDGYISGRALDDRVGCAMMVEMISGELEYDTHFAFTVQEETGTTGGKTAAEQIAPDVGIVIETTTACDIANVPDGNQVCKLKKGPVLSFMDRGTVYDMGLYQQTLSIAKENGIAVQSKAGVFGGNESRSVQVAGKGARVLAVSVPCRYLHTPACVANRFDIEQMLQLLPVLIREFGA